MVKAKVQKKETKPPVTITVDVKPPVATETKPETENVGNANGSSGPGDNSDGDTRVDTGGGDLGSPCSFFPNFYSREPADPVPNPAASKKRDERAGDKSSVVDDDPEHISYAEAGRLLGRSPGTVRRWVLEGLIASKREPTGRLRVLRADLQKFIDGSALEADVTKPKQS